MKSITLRLMNWLVSQRHAQVLRAIRGRLLDIGCGRNHLVRTYQRAGGTGTGVDVFDFGDVDLVVSDTAHMPFEGGSFDTVSLAACVNHIPNRLEVLREARRLLADDGSLLVTMIGPVVSRVCHWVFERHDYDQTERGMKEGEVWGFTPRQIKQMLESCGFVLVERRCFIFGLNNLYIAKKRG